METIRAKVDSFLNQYDMSPTNDLDADCQAFIAEMQAGLTEQPGTLKMLCTYISADREIPVNEPVIVMDAGGTNFRVALVTFDESHKPVIEDFNVYPMLGTQGEISSEDFYASIVRYLEPIINRSNRIGFCFSFPTVITPDRDGLLLGFNKEVKVRD
jgi:hexokinase